MKIDRGDYRACFVAMSDDPDIHAMSGNAFKLFWMLKLTLPTAGVGVVYPSTLCDQVGVTPEQLQLLFNELEAPKSGSDRGWILRDRTIVWVINALACEPTMTPSNSKHVISIRRQVSALSRRSTVVQAFRSHYEEWFRGEDDSPPSVEDRGTHREPQHTPSIGIREGIDSLSKQSQHNAVEAQFKGDAVDLEHPTARHADDAIGAADGSATASPAAQDSKPANGPGPTPLGTEARRFLYECYGMRRGAPTTPRQKQVRTDLHATLAERGALLERGVYVRAFSAQHLDDACSHVLGQKIKNPDAAIRLVLQFLQKTWQERKAAAEKAMRGDESERRGPPTGPTSMTSILTSAFTDVEQAEAAQWFASQPAEFRASIERKVAATVPATKAPMVHERVLRGAMCVAWREHATTADTARGAA